MIITKKAIPRRTVLRGLGVSLALPFLDGMVPALTAMRLTPAQPGCRLGVIYVPNGTMMDSWTPALAGTTFELTPTLSPLAKFRDRVIVLSGLSGAKGGGSHAGAATRFLTGVTYRGGKGGMDLLAEESIDQLIATKLGEQTQLGSLELSIDRNDLAGACDANFACQYTHTIAWRSASTPLPMENDPRAVFERLFGDNGSTNKDARLIQIKQERSILDAVTDKISRLQQGLGAGDRGKLGEYLEAVRDVERRIQKAEEQSAREIPLVDEPAGVPPTYEAHAKLMFDLQLLAYQCDLTRVITFMLGREQSGRSFPEIEVSEAWHPTSHHGKDPDKVATMQKINQYLVTLFAYYVERLQATPDGEGSLLDNMMILYGSGMADSDAHSANDLPLLLAGGAAGQLKGGRHLRFPSNTPMANLLVTIMDKFGLPVHTVGNSTGELPLDGLTLA